MTVDNMLNFYSPGSVEQKEIVSNIFGDSQLINTNFFYKLFPAAFVKNRCTNSTGAFYALINLSADPTKLNSG